MAVTKKLAFERWVTKSLRRRHHQEARERRRFDRERVLRGWSEWLLLDATRQALLPLMALLVLAVGGGWWLGTQQPCRPLLLEPGAAGSGR